MLTFREYFEPARFFRMAITRGRSRRITAAPANRADIALFVGFVAARATRAAYAHACTVRAASGALPASVAARVFHALSSVARNSA